jgi:amidase
MPSVPRPLPRVLLLAGSCLIAACGDAPPPSVDAEPARSETAAMSGPDTLEDLDVPALLALQADGEASAADLVRRVVADVGARDEAYRAVLALVPTAGDAAAALDAARVAGEVPGPLHGVPVMVKDNLETADAPTTAGALALAGNETGRDAPVVARLREAGAVIVAKTNLSEWANFRSERSSSGWSGVGGQTRNAVDPTRTPCGSSSGSGVAVALGYVPLAIGTETNGSIVCPSSINGIVGFKPTHGHVPGEGIVPIAHTQDTAGPMARSVADAALGYAVIADRAPEPLLAEVSSGSLAGMRLGVVRSAMGYHEGVDELFDLTLGTLEAAGAVIVDDLSLETPEGFGDDSYEVLLHEFRADLADWFASLPNPPEVDSLEGVIAFNREHADASMPYFRQEILVKASERGPLTDPAYVEAHERIQRVTGPEGIEALMAEHRLDALIAATEGPAWSIDLVNGDHFLGGFSTFAAVSGAPHLTLPMGTLHGLPIGLSFVARRDEDATVLALGHAFEALGERHAIGVPLP